MKKKAAIELSANILVIIIVSVIIISLGLILFFNLRSDAVKYTEAVEGQTRDQLRALMLNDNSKIAIYPTDLTIKPGKYATTTIAISNNFDEQKTFQSRQVNRISVYYYENPNAEMINLTKGNTPWWGTNSDKIIFSSGEGQTQISLDIAPSDQIFRNIIIKMPKEAKKGQYVFTFDISYNQGSSSASYGAVKLYVTV
ncbi:MAG: hypothetical protein ACP5NV_06020 [Candidatus Woesearchaeota archaeon]